MNRLYYYNYAIGEEILLKKTCNYYRDKLTDVTYEIVEEVLSKQIYDS